MQTTGHPDLDGHDPEELHPDDTSGTWTYASELAWRDGARPWESIWMEARLAAVDALNLSRGGGHA